MPTIKNIPVPDIGDFKGVEVIEIMVSPGDSVAAEDSLITLESDKSAMEIPSPDAGVVKEVKLNIGDTVAEGDLILTLELAEASKEQASAATTTAAVEQASPTPIVAPPEAAPPPSQTRKPSLAEPVPKEIKQPPPEPVRIDDSLRKKAHASPSVRRFARELGAALEQVKGSGRKGRIIKQDVQSFVKSQLQKVSSGEVGQGGGFAVPAMPEIDFAQFGEIENKTLSRIQKISGPVLHRSWVTIPHVTQHDETDITEMEAFRNSMKSEAERRGLKLTPLVFLMKAAVAALKEFPEFNASLSSDQTSLIMKKYFHIGFAVDTPGGLVVPVIRDVDQKGLFELSEELIALSSKARESKLSPGEMQGGCFTISSLGGIGGTYFTPIINAPEVAILGVSRSKMQPVYQENGQDGEFVPRLMLPLSLSYDHRVIDGAKAARFCSYLGFILADVRRLLI
ncbi:dihydrolipoyllysine-residue acetyltransferase [Candidatus Venteria ishoeyi]|uniref:Acetyltransferase component of pyruvate dehydrogenase complex n=1 Tax=Candidatus Venteria ishoeyi TaxID=1899563 RepID=A0A1H6FEC0_9GAMM|nr:dihydrolipoyllysine-residue acetyltransferase [Candidatus Venteria ishoeyi]SEH07364.1 Dihydrolipoyllysine-residue acetyltransferase component of pyruvate dehydrogenase complex [Candidatus Venteria ishoeyi]